MLLPESIQSLINALEATSIPVSTIKDYVDISSGGITEKQIAECLNLSLRSLQRKLEDKGYNYKNLLEETRRELAEQYIRNSNLSISEITYMLGFSEPSNFSRAFKRWTGKSPQSYRHAA